MEPVVEPSPAVVTEIEEAPPAGVVAKAPWSHASHTAAPWPAALEPIVASVVLLHLTWIVSTCKFSWINTCRR